MWEPRDQGRVTSQSVNENQTLRPFYLFRVFFLFLTFRYLSLFYRNFFTINST